MEQTTQIEELRFKLLRDERYLEYSLNTLTHQKNISNSVYDLQAINTALSEIGYENSCSDKAIISLSQVTGGIAYQKYLCSQAELFKEVQKEYSALFVDQETTKNTFDYFMQNSPEYAKAMKAHTEN